MHSYGGVILIVTKGEPVINRIAAVKNNEKWPGPVYVTYYISGICNLNYLFCLMPQKVKSVISEGKSDELLDSFESISCLFIMGAEPAIHPELTNHILKYANNRNIPVKFDTNGFAPLDCYIRLLKDVPPEKIEKITVSIDSMVPEIHNKLRQNENSLRNALNCVNFLKEKGYAVRVQMTVCDINYDSILYSVNKLYEEYKVDRFGFHCASVGGEAKRNKIKHLNAFKWRRMVQSLYELQKNIKVEEFSVPVIAMTKNELKRLYFADGHLADEYEKSLVADKGSGANFSKLCAALKQEFCYLIGYEKEGTITLCEGLAHAKGTSFSVFDSEQKKFTINTGSTSDINAINRSKFLCPAMVEDTGNSNGYEVNSKGEKLFYVCRHIIVPREELDDIDFVE